MSGIVSGRARVVFASSEFLHLSKGGLDGKIVAYRDSWIDNAFEMQDWVTFKAKPHEPEGNHGLYGVRYKAMPSSVKFESKGKLVDGLGTLLKVDESRGQYGFIKASDGSTVYFTASVVRPETKDIRSVFKTGATIRYRATEQKQNNVQWRAIAVCSKNASIDQLTSRQPKNQESVSNRTVVGLTPKKALHTQTSVPTQPISAVVKGTTTAAAVLSQSSSQSAVNNVTDSAVQSPVRGASASLSALSNGDSRSSSVSRSGTPCVPAPPGPPSALRHRSPSPVQTTELSSNLPNANSNILKQLYEIPPTGDAYEDAVRRLTYFTHYISDNSCNYCLLH